uniref:Transmembrane channel-like 6b n=1 Tax=Oryzias sinensis TaxID=183150 RepID=A0A8C7X7K4_9TELE
MAGNFDLNQPLMGAGLESPADEEGVHVSFSQLIAEQIGEDPDGFELQQLQRALNDEDRDYVGELGSAFEYPGRGLNDMEGEDDDGGQTDPQDGLPWSSATLKILSSMPSRTIGRSRGAILSQYYNKTLQLRRRGQRRSSIRDFSRCSRPTIRGYGMEVDTTDGPESESEALTCSFVSMCACWCSGRRGSVHKQCTQACESLQQQTKMKLFFSILHLFEIKSSCFFSQLYSL